MVKLIVTQNSFNYLQHYIIWQALFQCWKNQIHCLSIWYIMFESNFAVTVFMCKLKLNQCYVFNIQRLDFKILAFFKIFESKTITLGKHYTLYDLFSFLNTFK